MSIKVLLIDHYDSFTFNIKAWLEEDNLSVTTIPYDKLTSQLEKKWDLLILSPGPGKPRDYQLSLNILKQQAGKVPIFGICLGMQMLIHDENDDIKPYSPPLHGKQSWINTSNDSVFKELPRILVARYHSLATQEVTDEFNVIARTDDNLVMAVEHKTIKLLGFQFHPESFLTSNADVIRKNLVRWFHE